LHVLYPFQRCKENEEERKKPPALMRNQKSNHGSARPMIVQEFVTAGFSAASGYFTSIKIYPLKTKIE
jgi:hypothetical protein